MAIIVKHFPSGSRYVLLGAGFGMFQTMKSNWSPGDLVAETSEGKCPMVCVCDEAGSLKWIKAFELKVESIDGEDPKRTLGDED